MHSSVATRAFGAIFAALLALFVAAPCALEPPLRNLRTSGLVSKKAPSTAIAAEGFGAPEGLLGTFVQTHTDERVPLDDVGPSPTRFAALLADHVTGEKTSFDPRLPEFLRRIARTHPGCRIEVVSGYRSPKRNERMRKKGHHVASHSQHSLGHAVDFRIVPGDAMRGIDPRFLEKEIRMLGWDGGVGVYTLADDWFVHVDVGARRRWGG